MKLLICKASLALNALTVLTLGTAMTVDAASAYYIPNCTDVASHFCQSIESNSEAGSGSPDPEPPAKGGTGGSRHRAFLEKVDTILISFMTICF